MAPEMAVKRLEGREEATGGPRPALRGQREKAVAAGDLR